MTEFEAFRRETLERLDKLKTSVVILEESLVLYRKNLDDEMEKVIASIDPDHWRYYHAHIYSEFDEIEQDLPSVLRSSVLVHVYSVFEYILNQLCELYRNKKELSLSMKDLKHDGIMRAKVYLKKVAEAAFDAEGQEWNQIVLINKIRNILVHSGGVLSQSHADFVAINQHVNARDALSISEVNRIIIGKGYVEFAISTFKSFLLVLLNDQSVEFS